MTLDPVALRMGTCKLAKGFLQRRYGAQAGEIDIKRMTSARVLQMNMGVLEARQHKPPASIDNFSFLIRQRLDLGYGPQRCDPALM